MFSIYEKLNYSFSLTTLSRPQEGETNWYHYVKDLFESEGLIPPKHNDTIAIVNKKLDVLLSRLTDKQKEKGTNA